MTEVTLYGRSGCHLCDRARSLLADLRRSGYDFRLSEVDIDQDDALQLAYLERIPVVEINGSVVAELVPRRDQLAAALATVST